MLNRDFKELAEWRDVRGVEYLVFGGHALAAHGHPRCTGDIDFRVRPDVGIIHRLLLATQDFGFGSPGLSADHLEPDTVIQLGQPRRRIDLLTAIDGVEFDACFARRELMRIDGVTLSIIGQEDFKSNERAAGRLKDLADLEPPDPPP